MDRSIGLDLELKEEDSANSSESTEEIDDWGIIFSRLIRVYHMGFDEVLNLSYPQFKVLYANIFNEKTFDFIIPYLGSSDENEKDRKIKEVKAKAKNSSIDEISSVISEMNRDLIRASR